MVEVETTSEIPVRSIILNVLILVLCVLLSVWFVVKLRYFVADTNVLINQLACQTDICPIKVNNKLTLANVLDYPFKNAVYCVNALAQFIDTNDLSTISDLTVKQKLYTPNDKSKPIGLVCQSNSDKDIWMVLFRGTQTASDIVTDLNVSQVDYREFHPKNFAPKVHMGFYDTYNTFFPSILATLPLATIKRLVISGHSLGAALAILSGLGISQKQPTLKVEVFTFAAPAVGNQDFTSLFGISNRLIIRQIVNLADVIPQLPAPVSANLIDPFHPLMYSQNAQTLFFVFSDNRQSLLNNHYISCYADELNRVLLLEDTPKK